MAIWSNGQNMLVMSEVHMIGPHALWGICEHGKCKVYMCYLVTNLNHTPILGPEGGEVTPSYINAYTCAQDLFIGGLFTLHKIL